MAVDLSRIGLEGIETGQATLNAISARATEDMQRRAGEFELQTAQREQALDLEAAAKLIAISRGDSVPPDILRAEGVDEGFDSRTAPLDVLADVYMKGGSPKKGMDFLKAASEIEKREDEIKSAQFTRRKTSIETYAKTASLVGQMLGNAQNQSEWDYGLAQLGQNPEIIEVLGEENYAKLQEIGYDPDVVKYVGEQAMTQYQRASMDATATNRARLADNADARLRNSERMVQISQQRADDAARAQALKGPKAKEGKSAEVPSKQETDAVQSALVQEVFGGKPPATESKVAIKAGAYSIASRAKQILKQDQSLDWETAVNRAILESKANGEWDAGEDNLIMPDKPAAFRSKGGKADTPLSVPPDPTSLRKGMFYSLPDGRVGKFNGTGFDVN